MQHVYQDITTGTTKKTTTYRLLFKKRCTTYRQGKNVALCSNYLPAEQENRRAGQVVRVCHPNACVCSLCGKTGCGFESVREIGKKKSG